MEIRPYTKNDKTAVLELLRLNTPDFFDPAEEEDLIEYLDKEIEKYFVVATANGEIIGAGGINYFPEEKRARISWDIIRPDSQGKGIGKKLTGYRIDRLNRRRGIDHIIVRTSQIAYKFYEKMGFKVEKSKKTFGQKVFTCIKWYATISRMFTGHKIVVFPANRNPV